MASGANIKKADLTAAMHVCQTLESILKNSFGPNGLSTLLSSASGNICISNDGVALMQSIKFESPMGRMILDSIISHHRLTGDNSKSFVFILSELLCKISNKLSLSERESDIFKLRDGFTRLSTVLQTTVMKEIEKHSIFYKENGIKEACTQLVKTSIAGKFDMVTVNILSELVINLVFASCYHSPYSLHQSINNNIDDFQDLFLKISGQPVCMSKVIPGIVIQKDLCVNVLEQVGKPGKFILLNCSLEYISPLSHTTIHLHDKNQVERLFVYSTASLEQKLKCLNNVGINLILSTENLSDSSKHLCYQYKISVVNLLSTEDVDRVSKFTGVLINTNVGDVNDLSIGVLAHYERIAIGTKMCVNLVPKPMVKVNQVIICAPSPGLVTEYVRAVGNAMKVLRMWSELWDSDGLHKADTCCHGYSTDDSASQPVSASTIQPRLLTTPGGGAAEFIVSKILNDYATRHRDNYYLALAATLFAEAVLSIPRTLHQNSFVSKSKDNWISILTDASNNVSKGNGTISIDGKTGKLIDGFQMGLVVSLNSKMRLFTNVLELLQLLMKIDAIVI